MRRRRCKKESRVARAWAACSSPVRLPVLLPARKHQQGTLGTRPVSQGFLFLAPLQGGEIPWLGTGGYAALTPGYSLSPLQGGIGSLPGRPSAAGAAGSARQGKKEMPAARAWGACYFPVPPLFLALSRRLLLGAGQGTHAPPGRGGLAAVRSAPVMVRAEVRLRESSNIDYRLAGGLSRGMSGGTPWIDHC